jgi:enoyl-CoA hydratase
MSMRYEEHDGAAWLTLDAPERANALNFDDFDALQDGLKDATSQRIAVIAADGDRFCAGGDLDTIASLEGDEAYSFAEELVETLRTIETIEVPVLAEVNGAAYGAGLELVVAADLAVATEDATFGAPETRLGLQAPLTVERVSELAGKKPVGELVYTAGSVDAATAADFGILNDAVPSDELRAATLEYVEAVRETERGATRVTKERITGHKDYDEIKETMAERLAAPETRRRFRAAAERNG